MVKSKLLQSSSALIVDSRLTLAVTTSIKHVNKVTNLLLHFFHILIFNPTFIAAVFISSTNKTAWSITNSLQRCGVSLPSPILELERKDCRLFITLIPKSMQVFRCLLPRPQSSRDLVNQSAGSNLSNCEAF